MYDVGVHIGETLVVTSVKSGRSHAMAGYSE